MGYFEFDLLVRNSHREECKCATRDFDPCKQELEILVSLIMEASHNEKSAQTDKEERGENYREYPR